jgi:hypothetical protein
METLNFEIKWPSIKSPIISILIILTYFSITINGQCRNEQRLKPGENKNITVEYQACLKLTCEDPGTIWKKNQNLTITGMF